MFHVNYVILSMHVSFLCVRVLMCAFHFISFVWSASSFQHWITWLLYDFISSFNNAPSFMQFIYFRLNSSLFWNFHRFSSTVSSRISLLCLSVYWNHLSIQWWIVSLRSSLFQQIMISFIIYVYPSLNYRLRITDIICFKLFYHYQACFC